MFVLKIALNLWIKCWRKDSKSSVANAIASFLLIKVVQASSFDLSRRFLDPWKQFLFRNCFMLKSGIRSRVLFDSKITNSHSCTVSSLIRTSSCRIISVIFDYPRIVPSDTLCEYDLYEVCSFTSQGRQTVRVWQNGLLSSPRAIRTANFYQLLRKVARNVLSQGWLVLDLFFSYLTNWMFLANSVM